MQKHCGDLSRYFGVILALECESQEEIDNLSIKDEVKDIICFELSVSGIETMINNVKDSLSLTKIDRIMYVSQLHGLPNRTQPEMLTKDGAISVDVFSGFPGKKTEALVMSCFAGIREPLPLTSQAFQADPDQRTVQSVAYLNKALDMDIAKITNFWETLPDCSGQTRKMRQDDYRKWFPHHGQPPPGCIVDQCKKTGHDNQNHCCPHSSTHMSVHRVLYGAAEHESTAPNDVLDALAKINTLDQWHLTIKDLQDHGERRSAEANEKAQKECANVIERLQEVALTRSQKGKVKALKEAWLTGFNLKPSDLFVPLIPRGMSDARPIVGNEYFRNNNRHGSQNTGEVALTSLSRFSRNPRTTTKNETTQKRKKQKRKTCTHEKKERALAKNRKTKE